MKRIGILAMALFFSILSLNAQEFNVDEMKADAFDLTASTHQRKDLNGNPCGLVRVQIPLEGLIFEGNVIGDVANKGGEYLVYLTTGSKRLRVKHPNATPTLITFKDHGIESIEGKTTYNLRLSLPGIESKPSVAYTAAANIHNGHEYVDLGLSMKWATTNIGAETASDFGEYFAWGQLEPSKVYDESHCYMDNKKGFPISMTQAHDVARVKWGGAWQIPTKKQMEELVKKCKWEWVSLDGHDGCKVTGPNGNSIFLPACGYRYESELKMEGYSGLYWTGNPCSDKYDAFSLYFSNTAHRINNNARLCGFQIRPVTK